MKGLNDPYDAMKMMFLTRVSILKKRREQVPHHQIVMFKGGASTTASKTNTAIHVGIE